jgi:hypothetical protein
MRLEDYITEAVNGKKKHKEYEYEIPSAKGIQTSEDLIQFLKSMRYSEVFPFSSYDALNMPISSALFKQDSYCVYKGRNTCVKVFRRSPKAVYSICFANGKLADFATKEEPCGKIENLRSSEAIDEISVF